ncbi:MAG: competence protein ComK [Firmicutes bacterium]|nr:competence protein ComK [Bacillota bacterium]
MIKYMYMDYTTNSLLQSFESNVSRIPKTSVIRYLNEKCMEQGSSIEARKTYFKEKMGVHKFIPIVISNEEIYFPISNVKEYDCIWVNFFAIKNIAYIKKECIITFCDNTSLVSKYGKRIEHTMRSIYRYLHLYSNLIF